MKDPELPRDAELEASLGRAAAIMARLRAPNGCPWDLEQTFDSIKRHTLEEVYEVFDAIERRNFADLRDELGDLLLQVLFYAQMASDAGRFTLRDVADNLSAKLVRRHPHIFGDVAAETPDAVLRNWEQIKVEEKKAKGSDGDGPGSLLDDVPRSMPAMMEAAKIGSKAAKVHFDWPDVQGVLAKIEEELAEVRAELATNDRERIESEVGDLLFSVVHLARHLKVDPEQALRGTNARFRSRFAAMERVSADHGQELAGLSPDELETLWAEAKRGLAREQNKQKEGERP
jgi:ATP diphosphatase